MDKIKLVELRDTQYHTTLIPKIAGHKKNIAPELAEKSLFFMNDDRSYFIITDAETGQEYGLLATYDTDLDKHTAHMDGFYFDGCAEQYAAGVKALLVKIMFNNWLWRTRVSVDSTDSILCGIYEQLGFTKEYTAVREFVREGEFVNIDVLAYYREGR